MRFDLKHCHHIRPLTTGINTNYYSKQ